MALKILSKKKSGGLSPEAEKQMKKELMSAKSVHDMFLILGKYYDLKNANPGYTVRFAFSEKLSSAMGDLECKPKPEYT